MPIRAFEELGHRQVVQLVRAVEDHAEAGQGLEKNGEIGDS